MPSGTSRRRFRLYIDESGDHTYGRKEQGNLILTVKKREVSIPFDHYPELLEVQRRYLGILGCIVETEAYRRSFRPALEELKQRHFPHDPDEPVILHRSDIVGKRGPFWRLRDLEAEKAFNTDLLNFLSEQRYVLIVVVLDKKSHIERYGDAAYHPYHYCLTVMLERYCGFLNFCNGEGDVVAESRGGVEDRELKEAYRYVYTHGTQFREPRFFQRALTSKEIKLKKKELNIAGLQIADVLAYPLKQQVLMERGKISPKELKGEFTEQLVATVKGKFNRNRYTGRVEGYGKVFLG
ncbi:MAG: DUF3800 domain-containing protein [Moorellales bacterium]